jgi:regulator of protease activity HflC (stomatin/prohibitin superfamily)
MNKLWVLLKKTGQRANSLWEKNKTGLAMTLLTLLFFLFYFWNYIVYTVDSGEMAVKWKRFGHGTQLNVVYGEGLQLVWPWDHLVIYDVRIQEVTSETFVYTSNGLALDVQASVRFYPRKDTLPELHQRLGPNYIEKVVRPEVVSALRKVLGNYKPEEIYSMDEQGLLEDLRQIMSHEIVGDYIILSEFLLTRLSLPPTVQNSIQTKLTQEQRALAYDFILDRELKEKQRRIIEAEGIREFQAISGINILPWVGVEATKELATSPNAKIILIGTDQESLPVILNTGSDGNLNPGAIGTGAAGGSAIRSGGSAQLNDGGSTARRAAGVSDGGGNFSETNANRGDGGKSYSETNARRGDGGSNLPETNARRNATSTGNGGRGSGN